MVRVHADLCRQIEGNGQSGGAMREQVLVTLVGFFRVAHAGILAHGPEAATVHGGLHAPRKRELAGVADVAVIVPAFEIGRRIERLGLNVLELLCVGLGFEIVSHECSRHFYRKGREGRKGPRQRVDPKDFSREVTEHHAAILLCLDPRRDQASECHNHHRQFSSFFSVQARHSIDEDTKPEAR